MAIFCDWLSIYQDHASAPELGSGHVMGIDGDGSIEWQVCKSYVHEGSFSTKLLISSHGGRVRLSGNVGRFGRSNNLWGVGVDQTIELASDILESVGLPRFTRARLVNRGFGLGADFVGGAILTRVDLTANYSAGSQEDAAQYLNWLGGLQPGRVRARVYGDSTVSWGYGSGYWSGKCYNKFRELIYHGAEIDDRLLSFVRAMGVVRFEMSCKRRLLRERNMQMWGSFPGDCWEKLFEEKMGHIVAAECLVDDWLDIPNPYLGSFLAWREGKNLSATMPRSTFYKHRRALLRYGVDISNPCNVSRLRRTIRRIDVSALDAPDWYDLPRIKVA